MSWIEPYPRAALLTILALEAALLCARVSRLEAGRDHLRLLALLISLALDELAPRGLASRLAAYVVVLAAAFALAPRHRGTVFLAVACALAAAATVAADAAGWRSGPGPVLLSALLLFALSSLPVTLVFLERRWMGIQVFAAVLLGGLLWLCGRLASFAVSGVPAPGLPFALVIGLGVVAWWLTPDGPVSGQWHEYASRLEGKLESTEGQLRHRDRLAALGLLTAGAAHEFRSTLSGIGALAAWARHNPSAEAKDAALESVAERVEEASRSVASFLEGLSVQGREQARSIRLRTDLERLMAFVRSSCRRDGTSVRYEVSGDPQIVARPAEIEHILLNLLHNAARAVSKGARADRRIVVRACAREGSVVVEVQDNGGGVPEEVVPRLFSPGVPSAEGAGVGLYLARSLAERNGCRIEYEPVPGGSLFRVLFADIPGAVAPS